ncbi:MAG: AbrB/MazE/SpoVT family DNA-binding domain-containing protein [Candidatus Yonathbacteria bacterium]|nr:AbrB/MazE/SpoVT family DNA-binding domain-containing protein [Candidatus Yonathbacteria bacterium]
MTTKFQKWGNSLGLRIPKEILRELGWRVGTEVAFSVQGENLIIKRYNKTTKPNCLKKE